MTFEFISVFLSFKINFGVAMRRDQEYWATEIGRKIREKRKAEQLSLEKLSLLSGATVPRLSNIERGKDNITLATMVSICNALKIDLSHLFSEHAHQPTLQSAENKKGYNLEDDE